MEFNTSCEPMDVDLSTNSAQTSFKEPEENFDQSLNRPNSHSCEREPEVWNIKKYHIVRDKTKTENKYSTALVFVGLLVLFISVITYFILDIKCTNNLNLKELKVILDNRLYGQSEVIDSLLKSLDMSLDSKILFLYGGTGVGKTFTVSLALENFWNSSNVYHYTMPSFVNTFSTDTMLGLNVCESSIVVVDDLKQNDFGVKKQIADVIKKSQSLNKQITIFLIFNCDVITKDFVKKCDDSFYSDLKAEFNDIDAYKSFIQFNPLTQNDLKMCIEDELKGKTINDVDFNSILSNFNVTLDGCKGVYKKIKFLNLL